MPLKLEQDDELVKALRMLASEVAKQTLQQRDWRLPLRNGVLAGVGGVLGATILVSLFVYMLQPFKHFEALGPMIDRLDRTLQRSNK